MAGCSWEHEKHAPARGQQGGEAPLSAAEAQHACTKEQTGEISIDLPLQNGHGKGCSESKPLS